MVADLRNLRSKKAGLQGSKDCYAQQKTRFTSAALNPGKILNHVLKPHIFQRCLGRTIIYGLREHLENQPGTVLLDVDTQRAPQSARPKKLFVGDSPQHCCKS